MTKTTTKQAKRKAMPMDYNERKYWVEGSELLTEAEMIQMAKDLRELESRGVIEFRDGRWRTCERLRVRPARMLVKRLRHLRAVR